ncbi:AAA family ATPase [Xanthobacter sp. VTT E-85241]|uniref:AAA family ATPase n=1 Tax=Roseixanthobacter finlandensis TaxID=3119922 RepID=UPI0037294749
MPAKSGGQMSSGSNERADIYQRGAEPSIVQSFSIVGLYGYRTISLSSEYAATILIARNGSGKTTLLGALDAFLKMQFSRLMDLQFSVIKCKFRGIKDEVILSRDDISNFFDVSFDSDVAKMARKIEVESQALLRFLFETFPVIKDDYRNLLDDPIYSVIYRHFGYENTLDNIERLKLGLTGRVSQVDFAMSAISKALSGVEVVYLPTYRRIELPLVSEPEEQVRRRGRQKAAQGRFFNGAMQFGLGDIDDRLAEVNQNILINSNFGYRQISASIITELLDGSFEKNTADLSNIPSKDELNLFFTRIKEGQQNDFLADVTLPNIDKIYTLDQIPSPSNKFLKYFLGKLNEVIQRTRQIELPIEEFVVSCNKYLSSEDSISVDDLSKSDVRSSDGKKLVLNRNNLKIHAQSIWGGKKISLNSLSSGEKQMISLFAKIFLYPEKKLILIDEPELSLSMNWQRRILPDVISAPLCQQVIAITHSPFVFDNELDPFAQSLRIAVDLEALPPDSLENDASEQ